RFLFRFQVRRPPISPLFPYTTLFRSGQDRCEYIPAALRAQRGAHASAPWIRCASARTLAGMDARARAYRDVFTAVLAEAHRSRGDRKSTRLNSSHVKISYAVFCLKKK